MNCSRPETEAEKPGHVTWQMLTCPDVTHERDPSFGVESGG